MQLAKALKFLWFFFLKSSLVQVSENIDYLPKNKIITKQILKSIMLVVWKYKVGKQALNG